MLQNCTFIQDFNVIDVFYHLEKNLYCDLQCYFHVFFFFATPLIIRQGDNLKPTQTIIVKNLRLYAAVADPDFCG